MERFLKFKEDVSLKVLSESLSDERIIILRESKTTDTVQIQLLEKMSPKQIKNAFKPYTVTRIYNEFPYPIAGDSLLGLPLVRLKKLFAS